jgi:stalled ribosome rescue protein Dom34
MEKTAVWIDHSTTHIFDYDAEGAHPRAQLHNHQTTTAEGNSSEHTKAFYHEVATALRDSKTILLLGPGQAKEEFKNHCESHHPLVNKEIFKVESMKDHPSTAEILEFSGKIFKDHFNWTPAKNN